MSGGQLSDPRLQRAEKALLKALRERNTADLGIVLNTQEGRRWFCQVLFGHCRVLSPSFDPAIKDGNCADRHSAHNEGKRAVGLVLLEQAQNGQPDFYKVMLDEQQAQAAADRALRDELYQSARKEDDNER